MTPAVDSARSVCPMCGAFYATAAKECSACGESFQTERPARSLESVERIVNSFVVIAGLAVLFQLLLIAIIALFSNELLELSPPPQFAPPSVVVQRG